MFDAGYKNIVNIDFSKIVISSMQEKYSDYGQSFKCKASENQKKNQKIQK